jgi:hypothetical protein
MLGMCCRNSMTLFRIVILMIVIVVIVIIMIIIIIGFFLMVRSRVTEPKDPNYSLKIL